jgi:putative ABC transport system permease protein
VVNASLAANLFPGRSAVGQTVTETDGAPSWEIVGVVSDINEFGPAQTPRPTIYWPYGSQGMGDFASPWMSIVVRTAGDPLAVLPAIREQLRAMDRDLPISRRSRILRRARWGSSGVPPWCSSAGWPFSH